MAQSPLEQAGRDDWLVFSVPALGVTTGTLPEPRPTAEWFGRLAGLRLESEREVEVHFVQAACIRSWLSWVRDGRDASLMSHRGFSWPGGR